MNSALKARIIDWLLPLVAFYMRKFPFSAGKLRLFKNFHWRERILPGTTNFGSKMMLRTSDLVQGYIYYFGVWEPNLTAFLTSRFSDSSDRTFVDVGANVGYYTLLASKKSPKGSVVAIEAFPAIHKRLLENIKKNDCANVRALNLAATEVPCVISMYHAGNKNEGATTSMPGKHDTVPVSVDGLPLKDILTEAEIQSVRVIKIDTEGAEFSVLKGLFPLLDRMPKDVEIVVELNPNANSEEEIRFIFDTFQAANYSPYEIFNDYSPESYIYPNSISSLKKIESIPDKQVDVVFSRCSEYELCF